MRISPIQTGWAEIPISTKIIAPRSKSERGLSAERIPIGIATSIQRIAPPITRDAVTGAARLMISLTGCRVAYELPSDGVLRWSGEKSTGMRPPKNRRYCT